MEVADYTNGLSIGKKIEAVRRFRGITQSDLGEVLGMSKQAVSKIEQTKKIDDERLKEIAKALNVNPDAIKNFNEEATFNIIANTYYHHSSSVNYQFNPIEKIVELYQQKIELYERMLKEKNELIEKLMKERK